MRDLNLKWHMHVSWFVNLIAVVNGNFLLFSSADVFIKENWIGMEFMYVKCISFVYIENSSSCDLGCGWGVYISGYENILEMDSRNEIFMIFGMNWWIFRVFLSLHLEKFWFLKWKCTKFNSNSRISVVLLQSQH